jgi:hypothetical protein
MFAPPRALTCGGSPSGCPRLIGVESWRNEGIPVGRSRGKTSNAPTASAWKPNEVRVDNPRRERSSHDEVSVRSNMVSSCADLLTDKDTAARSSGLAGAKKKAALDAAFWELS